MFTPQMFLESLWSCAPPPIVVSFLQWGVNFIKYVQRNPEVSSIKSFVGIQLHPNWLNACNLRFASNVGLSYNVSHLYQSALSHDTSSLLSHFYRSLALFTCHYPVTPDYEHSLVSFIVVLPGSAESKLWSQPTPFMKKETKVNKHNVVFQFSLIDFFTTQFARLHFIQLEVHWHSSSWRETQLVGIFDFFYILSREKVKGLQLGFIAWDWENPSFLFI